MKRFLFVFSLLLTVLTTHSQNSFEGAIKFSTQLSVSKNVPAHYKQQLIAQYGDSLLVSYLKNGDFKRLYLNSSEDGGYDSQYYDSQKGMLYIRTKNSTQIDSLDMQKNSLKLTSKKKVKNQRIMGLKCKCYEYKAVAEENYPVVLNFCFSTKSPEIDPVRFSKHNDFFLNDFYQTAKRPYLKFSLKTEHFILEYLATGFIQQQTD